MVSTMTTWEYALLCQRNFLPMAPRFFHSSIRSTRLKSLLPRCSQEYSVSRRLPEFASSTSCHHGSHAERRLLQLHVVRPLSHRPTCVVRFEHGRRHCTLASISSDDILVPTRNLRTRSAQAPRAISSRSTFRSSYLARFLQSGSRAR